MKVSKFILVLLALMLASIGAASAHGWRSSVGVYVGPGWGPMWYPAPYYYPPQVIVTPPPAPPPVYIEQSLPPAETQYWYYCPSGKGYYPYIKTCPEGWSRVLPQPER